MIDRRGIGPQARLALALALVCALATLLPAGSSAARTKIERVLGITIPASAKVHTAATTSTPTTSTPASTSVPATNTPTTAATATSAPTGAGQPGTVAPTTTTPTGAATQTASTTTPATTTPASTSAPGSTTVIVAHKPKSSKGLSTGALLLAILGALLLLACLVWALARWRALEPRWTVSLTHSLREAAHHASETWAEFSDWARLGH